MKIIITTDGSDFSIAAAQRCCDFVARPEETSLKVVSVYDMALPVDAFAPPVEYAESIETGAREQAAGFAASASAVLRERFGDSLRELTAEVHAGSPEQVVVERAREWGADLVVVGSHGRGFWERMLLGSTTDALVHHSPCSVLVVRA